jgi:hypothetical protein
VSKWHTFVDENEYYFFSKMSLLQGNLASFYQDDRTIIGMLNSFLGMPVVFTRI